MGQPAALAFKAKTMINFFRRIRKKLADDNKPLKYMRYAIGEIVLVVIGILIALQINNASEFKKLKAKELNAVTEIITDLESNILRLEGIISKNTSNMDQNIRSIMLVIDYLEKDRPYNDSLSKHFSNINQYNAPHFKISGYQTLSSMGMDIVLDDKLRSEIGKFYTATATNLDHQYLELRDDFYNYMLEYMRKDFISISGQRKRVPKNYEILKSNGEYLESLKIYSSVYSYYRLTAKEALEEAQILKNHLNTYQELKK
jgi:hypothetical protein